MREHPESELHRQGKMFGVLVVENHPYLAAFSAKLDGSYYHDGYVPPVYEMTEPPVGSSKEESQRLQRLLFAQYNLTNHQGETRNLMDIFANERAILSVDEWFNKSKGHPSQISLPPSGAGECCAPKLLQYAFTHGLSPIALAEFWVGAPSRTEVRQEGQFYTPCSGRCVPILKWQLGISPTPAFSNVEKPNIEVLYDDEWLMVVNKPAGVLSVPGKTGEPCVADLLGVAAQPVHRLDQDTSGLLVLAKTRDVYTTLQAYFQRRDVRKRYVAVVKPTDATAFAALPDEGLIELPLIPNPYDRPRQMVSQEHGRPSITQYKIRERRTDGTALVDFFPQTGRTHQLRVHAAHPDGLGAPIIGDRLYGGLPANRLMLHAAEITFIHPIYLSPLVFDSSSSSSW